MGDYYKQYFFDILKKYRLGQANEEEVKFLEAYYNVFEINEELVHNEKEFGELKDTIKNKVDERIHTHSKGTSFPFLRNFWIRYAVAASVLVCLSVTAYFLMKPTERPLQFAQEVMPGSNKAILTLPNGKKIVLDDAGTGEIAEQSGISITKTKDGQLVYKVIDKNSEEDAKFAFASHTISTPKGGQYQVILPDGTRVWLNAASSLSYPASFHGNERLVTLNGEAYFEVTKNKEMPFRVKSGNQTVEVLGTHFNINAYADESTIKTTLLEGSVNVASGGNDRTITPGEQALVNKANPEKIVTDHVNIEKETAWKNGVFAFENDDLKSIMRQISRWYDVEIVYAGKPCDEKYFGEISRNSKLSEVFKILELNNIDFRIYGKTVTVSCNN